MSSAAHNHLAEGAVRHSTLQIEGMNCASCVNHVERAARQVSGVSECRVNLASGRAEIAFDSSQTDPAAVAHAITAAGYPSHERSSAPAAHSSSDRHHAMWRNRAIAGLILWLPVELAHWAMQIFGHGGVHEMHATPSPGDPMIWAALISSSLAMLYIGRAFYASAWSALRRGTSNMDTLIAMGATVAWAYSMVSLIGQWKLGWSAQPLYFMEASGLLALISLGHWMEARARQSAGSAIRQLLELAPAVAVRLDDTDQPREVSVADVQHGDRLLVRPGDRVPVDGVILAGQSAMDESMITGEPLPVTRFAGESVTAGTISTDGRLTLRATRVGQETTVAQIVRLVERAQSSKPPVQKLADRISAIFVPSVLCIAAVTAVAWSVYGSLHHWSPGHIAGVSANAVCSVLIIACPCALGLALPAAVMVGTGMGARRGILIRDIDVLQKAEHVTVIVLDKTGTITEGKPAVQSIVTVDGMPQPQLLSLAASAAQFSNHPLARAIVEKARAQGVPIREPARFSSEAGLGVCAEVEGRTLLVGNEALLRQRGAEERADDGLETVVKIAQSSGGAVRRLGHITFADRLREKSVDVVAQLQRLGMRTVLLTGDTPAAAQAIASAVHVSDVRAGVRPAQKADAVEQLKRDADGGKAIVAMVGDGINDAAALAAADVGIALGSGTDIAKETAGVVLVGQNLGGVISAIHLSRATMRVIRQNLFLAFFYNVLAIPLAALGVLNPLIAAGAMALSDVTVLLNALRLRRFDIEPFPPGKSDAQSARKRT